MTNSYQKICFTLTSDLHPRTKDILARRFGLESSEPETLEAIGQAHSITRERVRQIVEDGIRQVREGVREGRERARLQEIFDELSGALKEAGHVKREDLLIDAINAGDSANHVIFILHLGDGLYKQKETEYVHPYWTDKAEVFHTTPSVLDQVLRYLEKQKQAMELEELLREHGSSLLEERGLKASTRMFSSMLEVSKHITQGYNEKWGLKRWPEVYPKGMRDKAYVVLKNHGKPLHFNQVAELIDQLQASLVDQRRRNILPQTVHNELIKDQRFVLVGRGTYALAEWGFKPGTVKDVLVQLLKENGDSMEKDEIVQKTLAQRQVKESTILLNLQDKALFWKDPQGRYHVQELPS